MQLFSLCVKANTCATVSENGNERPLRILFFTPQSAKDSFWDMQRRFTEHVAEDLGIELETISMLREYQNRFSFVDLISEKITNDRRPDFVVGLFYSNGEANLLHSISKNKVPYFSFNTSLEEKGLRVIGQPRERYKYWIGHMTPDDESAGHELMMSLADKTSLKSVAAIAGAYQSNVSRNREMGLRRAVSTVQKSSASDHVGPKISLELLPVMHSDWSPTDSANLTRSLLNRVGRVDAFWTAGMDIASGVLLATQEFDSAYRPLIGTFDWSPGALDAIEKEDLQIALGGHFMEGGRAMIMLLDYANGIDFKDDLGVNIRTKTKACDLE